MFDRSKDFQVEVFNIFKISTASDANITKLGSAMHMFLMGESILLITI